MCNSDAGITRPLPQIMGLVGAGVMEAVGASETPFSVGQPVVIYPGVHCGRCEFCQCGEGVLCVKLRCLDKHRDGNRSQLRLPIFRQL